MNLDRMLNQVCTYWIKQAGTNSEGKAVYSAPVSRKVRWEDTMTSIQDKHGADSVSKSTVFSAADWDLNGYLFLGTSADADPTKVPGAFEIIQVSRVPDLRNLQTLYTAYL